MKWGFKCKLCGKELQTPSKTHIKEDYAKMIGELDKAVPFQFYDLIFSEEWSE